MPPETRIELITLRLLTARIRMNRRASEQARAMGQMATAACHMGLAMALEREVLDRIDRLEASGTLIAIEAAVSSATSWAQAGRTYDA